jgi:mannose/cellobiose epimerase-like protein (N-acyl-D-glucosamine 2-epimerase family)
MFDKLLHSRFGAHQLPVAAVLVVLSACEPSPQEPPPEVAVRHDPHFTWAVDALVRDVLNPRLTHGLAQDGFYKPNLGPDWQPETEQSASLVSQSRIIYVFAMGYEVTSDPRYLAAMLKAGDYLLSHFASKKGAGHWLRRVNENGESENDGFHAYGHAQAMFALAHAYKVSGAQRYLDAAMHTWVVMDVPSAIAGENSLYDLRGLNVTMHIFEGLLALQKATASEAIRREVDKLGRYIVAHFHDPQRGFFAEGLTTDLKIQPDGEVRTGHAIEMSFLLSRAVDAGLPASYLDAAQSAVTFVADIAAKDPRGLIPHTTDYEGRVRDAEYYWWSQTELLRGLAHFIVHRGRTDLRSHFDRALGSVKANYVDPLYAGWHIKSNTRNENKGSPWKVGYHVTMYLTELIRLGNGGFRSGLEVLL